MFLGMGKLNAQIDSLVMNTGEILVGEIKDLKQGVIVIETDYSDSDFKVEWDKVKYINTDRKYLITTTEGDRYHGSLESKGGPEMVTIQDLEQGAVVLNIIDVVFMKSVDETFLSRLDILMSVGYSLTKANESQQFSARLNAGYSSHVFGLDLYYNSVRSVQKSDSATISTIRTEGGAGVRFFLYRDWFAMTNAEFLQSSEQKLDLRSLVTLGFGNYMVNTNRMYFVMLAGGAWNIENYGDAGLNDRNSVEVFAGLEYNIFDIGDLNMKTSVYGYPSLTEKGRFRTDFSFDLKYDFPLDFFINLGYTLNYDNKPVEGASDVDYVLQTTFGWEL